MTKSLESTVEELATEFAEKVLAALQGMSLEDLIAQSGAPPRAATRGSDRAPSNGGVRRLGVDVEAVVGRIVGVLKKHGAGLRAEQIRAELGLTRKDIDRPIVQALAAKKISKKGQRRGTKYFAR